jgi:RNA polymerase sigma-70 factor (ECF subfamily)
MDIVPSASATGDMNARPAEALPITGRVDSPSERRLLDRVRRGDDAALDALVRLHADAVYRFALRLTGRAHEAEDLAQETFARALRHARDFRAESGFRTWLFRIAINAERDAGRRRRSAPIDPAAGGPRGEADRETEPRSAPDASHEAEANERRRAVRELVDRLPDLQRESLVLRVYEDLPYADVAEILGITVGAAKMNLL